MNRYISLLFAIFIISSSCKKDDNDVETPQVEYRNEMRNFVIGISESAKAENPNFLIIPQNGAELITQNGEEDGPAAANYLAAIDAHGQEDLFYGYENDNEPTPLEETNYLLSFLNISKAEGNAILITDYCSGEPNVSSSYAKNDQKGYVSFAADDRELRNIPLIPQPIHQENANNVESISQVKNFLYLINPADFNTKSDFIEAVTTTNYDLILMDYFFNEEETFTSAEIDLLREKENGGTRLVLSYMSIGEAEDYRYYFDRRWNINKPEWLDVVNPDWLGNYKVKYWKTEWQNIIYGTPDSYLTKIVDVGFDGVYLDIIDAYEYYED